MRLAKFTRLLNLAEGSALAVFLASSLAMVVKALFLNDMAAPFEWLNRLSPMGDSVLTSLIAGSLFFLVVNSLFDRAEFGRMRPWMKIKFRQVAGQYEGMVRDMAGGAGVTIPDDIYTIDLEAILSGLNPNDPAPLIVNRQGHHANWVGLAKYYANRARRFLDRIDRRSSLLRTESLELIDRVYDSPFFGQIDNVDTPLRNQNMEFLSSSLIKFRDLMREVKQHAEFL